MKQMKRLNISSILLIAVLLSIIGYQAVGERPLRNQTVRIATIDLQRAINGLQQREVAAQKLQEMNAEFTKERNARESEINSMRDELRRMAEAAGATQNLPPEAQRLEEQMVLKHLRYEAWMRFMNDRFDVEYALMLQDLIRTIRNSASKLANEVGYSVILLDDSREELSVNPQSRQSREAQIRQQITARRILYSQDEIDITTDLVERMNNEFRAARR